MNLHEEGVKNLGQNKCWGKPGKIAKNDSINFSFLLRRMRIFYGKRSKRRNFVNVSHSQK